MRTTEYSVVPKDPNAVGTNRFDGSHKASSVPSSQSPPNLTVTLSSRATMELYGQQDVLRSHVVASGRNRYTPLPKSRTLLTGIRYVSEHDPKKPHDNRTSHVTPLLHWHSQRAAAVHTNAAKKASPRIICQDCEVRREEREGSTEARHSSIQEETILSS